jgi:hypothetical protein
LGPPFHCRRGGPAREVNLLNLHPFPFLDDIGAAVAARPCKTEEVLVCATHMEGVRCLLSPPCPWLLSVMVTPIALPPPQMEQRMQKRHHLRHPFTFGGRASIRGKWRDRSITASLIALILIPVGFVVLSLLREVSVAFH